MARKTTKSSSSAGAAKTRRRRSARAVTIDLEATEVDADGPGRSTVDPDPRADAETPGANPDPPGNTEPDNAADDQPADPGKDISIPVATFLKFGAAGLAGGVLALLIYSGLARFGLVSVPAPAGVAELAGSLDQLRGDFDARETARDARLGAIEARLAAGEPGADTVARLGEMDARISALVEEISTLEASSIQRLGDSRDAIDAEIAALSGRLPADDTSPRLAGLEARLGVIEANTKTLLAELQAAADSGTGVPDTDFVALRQSLTALQAAVSETQATLAARMDGLGTVLDGTGSALAALSARIDAANSGVDRRIADLEARASTFGNNPFATSSAGAEARAAASLAFAALERAVREGLAYSAELELLTGITDTIPDEIVAALAPGADTGVPTVADLADEFGALATPIIDAGSRSSDAGLLDQTLTRIRSVVRIRPTGFVEGDSVGAIVARTEAYLGAGQLKAAVGELVVLDGPAGEAAAGWFGAATARLAVGDALIALNRYLLNTARPAQADESQ